MFNYNSRIVKLSNSIKIVHAEIIEGKFDFIKGEYQTVTYGALTKMLKLEFVCEDNLMTDFYVSNNDFSVDFQHTTSEEQRSFFFPIPEDAPIEQLRIYGVKIDIEQSNIRLRPIGEAIGKSELIQDVLKRNASTSSNKKKNKLLPSQSLFKKESEIKIKEEIPEYYCCSITLQTMEKPVICTLDGKTYEDSAIRAWLSEHKSSPWNRKELPSGKTIDDVLCRNLNLETAIEHFTKENPHLFQEQKNRLSM